MKNIAILTLLACVFAPSNAQISLVTSPEMKDIETLVLELSPINGTYNGTCSTFIGECATTCVANEYQTYVNDCFEYVPTNSTALMETMGECICARPSKGFLKPSLTNDRNAKFDSECSKFYNDPEYKNSSDILVKSCIYGSVKAAIPFIAPKPLTTQLVLNGKYMVLALSNSYPFGPNGFRTLNATDICMPFEKTCIDKCKNEQKASSFECGLFNLDLPRDFNNGNMTSKLYSDCECIDRSIPIPSPNPVPVPGPSPSPSPSPSPAPQPPSDDRDAEEGFSANWIIGIVAIVVGSALVIVGGVVGYKRYSARRGYSPVATA